MSWIDAITGFLNPIMHPLVQIHPFFAVAIVSFFVALFNSWIYKVFTDQHKMKALKEDMKHMQADIKKYKDNTSKMLDIQSRLMQKNMEYMKQSFKPTLITLIPILIILGWMTGHLAYDSVQPNMPVNVAVFLTSAQTGSVLLQVPFGMEIVGDANQPINTTSHAAMWTVKGVAGTYNLDFTKGNETVSQQIIIAAQDYAKPIVTFSGSQVFSRAQIGNSPKKILDFGAFSINYFWTYFICAIAFSLGIRKLMKLH